MFEDCKKNKTQWTAIDSGLPIAGNTAMQSFDYYKYTQPRAGNNVIISVMRDFGDIDIYVYLFDADNPIIPNSNTAIWKDTSSNTVNDTTQSILIEIRGNDEHNCVVYPCTYGISVHCGMMDVPTGMDSANMKCQYTIIVSSNGENKHSITRLQSSQPMNDMIRKNDIVHLYEYDYYALSNEEKDDITITVTAMQWTQHSIRDVNIYVSFISPLSQAFLDWTITNVGMDGNSLMINHSQIHTNDTLYIGVALSEEYTHDSQQNNAFEFSIMCYTKQTVKLSLETPLVVSLKPGASDVFKAMVDIGMDFSVFIAGTNNVSGVVYMSNLYNNNNNNKIELD